MGFLPLYNESIYTLYIHREYIYSIFPLLFLPVEPWFWFEVLTTKNISRYCQKSHEGTFEDHSRRPIMTIQFSYTGIYFGKDIRSSSDKMEQKVFRVWGCKEERFRVRFSFMKKKRKLKIDKALLVSSPSLLPGMLVCMNLNLGIMTAILSFWDMAGQKDGKKVDFWWRS